ncbi:MAG: hypothetical protein E2586_04070 [Novosphingobium sp.]|uniref:hypothetical protein n=1 Tax=Novosphingobium sp. TaxID=1874826 RepID=UPI0012CC5619|nr:hypothetical protein [Novosphingobium sp.]MPS67656.1 hypothetical protein [Novosphingobium sp.]
MRLPCLLIAVLPLAACGSSDSVPGPGAVTMGEARALGEAAEMLEVRRPPAGVGGAHGEPGKSSPSEAATPARN